MQIRSTVYRSTLANANQTRDWRIYAEFAQSLIQTERKPYINEQFNLHTYHQRKMVRCELIQKIIDLNRGL